MTTSRNVFESILIVFGILLAAHWYTKPRLPKGYKFPPGPKGLPFIGNLLIMSKFWDSDYLEKLKNEYGPIVSIEVLGTRIVVVNSAKVARDLLEKRSGIYSDRHAQHTALLFGWTFNFAIMRYSDRWRRHRRLFHQYFNSRAVEKHLPIQMQAVKDLLRRLYEKPEDFMAHTRHVAAFIIMKVLYNYDVQKKDPYVDIVAAALDSIGAALNPGSYIVDFLPWLQILPEWFPGTAFKTKARLWYEPTQQVVRFPFDWVKQRLAKGEAGQSVVAACLKELYNNPDATPDEEEIIMNTSGIAYAAGASTSFSSIATIILAAAMYPEIQKKVQEELDQVLGDKLPTMDDKNQLPYLKAFCDETHRWRPGVPFGVAHAASEDDIYGEYFIPKGSIVAGNSWGILRDEAAYGPDVEEFIPERFFKVGVEPPTAQFGFGRRICPGRFLANTTHFIAAATVLKVFEITPAKDENGKQIPITGKYEGGAMIHPEQFRCVIKPRSSVAEKLILEAIST